MPFSGDVGSDELVEFISELVRDVWPELLVAGELRDISLDLSRRAELIDILLSQTLASQLKLKGRGKEICTKFVFDYFCLHFKSFLGIRNDKNPFIGKFQISLIYIVTP